MLWGSLVLQPGSAGCGKANLAEVFAVSSSSRTASDTNIFLLPLPRSGSLPYSRLDEGGCYSKHVAKVQVALENARKCTFRQADACNLPME